VPIPVFKITRSHRGRHCKERGESYKIEGKKNQKEKPHIIKNISSSRSFSKKEVRLVTWKSSKKAKPLPSIDVVYVRPFIDFK